MQENSHQAAITMVDYHHTDRRADYRHTDKWWTAVTGSLHIEWWTIVTKNGRSLSEIKGGLPSHRTVDYRHNDRMVDYHHTNRTVDYRHTNRMVNYRYTE